MVIDARAPAYTPSPALHHWLRSYGLNPNSVYRVTINEQTMTVTAERYALRDSTKYLDRDGNVAYDTDLVRPLVTLPPLDTVTG